jgi:DNA invertase Pin-like site-specific DNA recombinase
VDALVANSTQQAQPTNATMATADSYLGYISSTMATAHSYLRYSTPEQALGDSERRQIEKAQEWAVANAYDYDDTYRDPATSAFRSKNRAVGMLGQFFDDVRSGRIPKGDLLLTESFDRLSR